MLPQFDKYVQTVLETYLGHLQHGGAAISYKKLPVGVRDIFEQVVPEEEFQTGLYFDIWTHPERRKTDDTMKVLEEFIQQADQKGIYLFGHCLPYESRDDARFEQRKQALVTFYTRLFGFRHMGDGWIYRKPTTLAAEAYFIDNAVGYVLMDSGTLVKVNSTHIHQVIDDNNLEPKIAAAFLNETGEHIDWDDDFDYAERYVARFKREHNIHYIVVDLDKRILHVRSGRNDLNRTQRNAVVQYCIQHGCELNYDSTAMA